MNYGTAEAVPYQNRVLTHALQPLGFLLCQVSVSTSGGAFRAGCAMAGAKEGV